MKKAVWICSLLLSGGAALADHVDQAVDGGEKAASLLLGVPTVFLIGVVVVAFIIAFIVTGSMKAKLKTAAHQAHASNYVRKDSLVLDVNRDQFLYDHVERRKIKD